MPRGIVLSTAIVLGLAISAPAATLTVDLNGGADYTDIQSAIDAAADGDTILVMPGEYVVTVPISYRGKGITVRGESGPETTTIRMAEEPADPQRGNVVRFENGETSAAVLEGLKITGGKAKTRCSFDTVSAANCGGGVWCWNSCPTLVDCRITGNAVTCYGGGVACEGAAPTLMYCMISDNSAVSYADGGCGGGISCRGDSLPVLTDCTITRNRATDGAGGGLFCANFAAPRLTRCAVVGNNADRAGGMSCGWGSSPMLTDCTIADNWATDFDDAGGGGLECSSASPTLVNCRIVGNMAGHGGGVCVWGDSSLTLMDCTLTSNTVTCTGYGGGIECLKYSSTALINCTIAGNAAANGGGVACREKTSTTLTNCIVWGNAGGAISLPVDGAALLVTYSCIESAAVLPGTGNINHDPQFCGWTASEAWVDATHAEPGTGTEADPYARMESALAGFRLSLQDGSPCKGSGEGGADMGAKEGSCAGGGFQSLTVHLKAGTYTVAGVTCAHNVSIAGAGQESVVIEGTLYGLRTGVVMCNVTVSKGTESGIVIASGEAPEIRDCTISGNSARRDGGGVCCAHGSSPTLTNCTISGNSSTYEQGGALFCIESSPMLTNCTISMNSASYQGGGVSCLRSSPILLWCTISRNAAGGDGGGIQCTDHSCPVLSDCVISENTSGHYGGGIDCKSDSCPRMTRCAILGNTADAYGGGVYSLSRSSLSLSDCRISENTAPFGGGLHFDHCSPTLTNCVITKNRGGSFEDGYPLPGGGVFCGDFAHPVFTNCTIAGNSAGVGGGVACWGGSPTLINCTVSGNFACQNGGGMYCSRGVPTLTNSIVWGNSGGAISVSPSSMLMPVVTYSCIECDPVWVGTGNINTDPLFVLASEWGDCPEADPFTCVAYLWNPDTGEPLAWLRWFEGDCHLQPASPCIDVATSEGAPADDLERYGRPCGAGVDMGAYEFGDCRPSTRFRRGDANASGRVDIADAISVLSYLFGTVGNPSQVKVAQCVDAADANDDGKIDIADAIKILGHMFTNTGPLPGPFGECGIDPTVDVLDCGSFAPCE